VDAGQIVQEIRLAAGEAAVLMAGIVEDGPPVPAGILDLMRGVATAAGELDRALSR
jgi:hypothetical protein